MTDAPTVSPTDATGDILLQRIEKSMKDFDPTKDPELFRRLMERKKKLYGILRGMINTQKSKDNKKTKNRAKAKRAKASRKRNRN